MPRVRQVILLAVAALCALFLSLPSALPSPNGASPMREMTPPRYDGPLSNPGMGLYIGGTLDPSDMPADAWFSSLLSIGYFRDDWSLLEPDAEGKYTFDEYFGPIFDLWVKRWGKRVAFRFMSENMHSRSKYVTPKWVFDSGVPGVTHRGLYTDVQIDPVFWDERYLRIQERFIADLGKYLDGRPGLEFIDIGCIGEWGEMHLQRWTPEQLEETGYTEDKYIAAYRRIIDAFARAFPHTRVFLNVGDYDAINDYAALRGLHFRQDGLTPAGPSSDVGNRLYRPYSRRGVICNYEFHSSYNDMKKKGWGVKATFDKGLSDPISYMNTNLVGYDELRSPAPEIEDAVTDAANRIGFRLVLDDLRCNGVVHVDGERPGRLVLQQTWENIGVAPCYDSYALRWSLVDSAGKAVTESVTFPRQPTSLWWPGRKIPLHDMALIPAATPPGVYRLRLEMLKPEQPGLRIQLGIAGRDAEGRYDLGEVRVERVERRSETVYDERFAAGPAGWSATAGMTATVKKDADSEGNALLITGAEPGRTWSYASTRVSVLPYSRYRLSCWLKVDRIEPDQSPSVKLGVNRADGTWITNFTSVQYDLSRLGAWQRLVADADTPALAANADIAIEKGVLETPVTASIWIRDVKLELLETP